MTITTNERRNYFIEQSNKVHSNKYDYTKVVYVNTHTKVIIICPVHGEFIQTPAMHQFGQGCKQCSIVEQRTSKPDFIKQANKIHHSKYNYDLVQDYQISRVGANKIPIGCPIHGVFFQRPGDHLNKHGCPGCKPTSTSNKALSWLDYVQLTEKINIQHANNGGELCIPGTKMYADGFCTETNTIYEFDGDAFHGNPNRYAPTDTCHPYDKTISANELYLNTIKKHNRVLELGFKLVTIWESEFDQLGIEVNQYDLVVQSKIDNTYTQQLKEIGITLLEPYKGAKIKHLMKCDECGSEWRCTPLSKIQTNKNRGSIGCPLCNRQRSANSQRQTHKYEARLLALNYKVTEYKNAATPALLECLGCGNKKTVIPSAIIQRNKPCCER